MKLKKAAIMTPNIGLSEKNRKAVSDKLALLLANEYALSLKTRKAHWNVQGIDFADKHKLFEEQYNELNEIIDQVAERIRTLGFFPPATLKQYSEMSDLQQTTVIVTDSKVLVEKLLTAHEQVINQLRTYATEFSEEYNDEGTTDFVIALMQTHEKTAWFLRSHLG